jgi:hypothetical protein
MTATHCAHGPSRRRVLASSTRRLFTWSRSSSTAASGLPAVPPSVAVPDDAASRVPDSLRMRARPRRTELRMDGLNRCDLRTCARLLPADPSARPRGEPGWRWLPAIGPDPREVGRGLAPRYPIHNGNHDRYDLAPGPAGAGVSPAQVGYAPVMSSSDDDVLDKLSEQAAVNVNRVRELAGDVAGSPAQSPAPRTASPSSVSRPPSTSRPAPTHCAHRHTTPREFAGHERREQQRWQRVADDET